MLSIILVAVGLVAAVISATSVWFSVTIPNTASGTISGSYSIFDVYNVISQFVSAFTNHGTLHSNINSAPSGGIVLLLVIYLGASSTYFVPILAGTIFLFWPLVILLGLLAFVKRGIAYVSGILSVSLFIFAFGLVAKLGRVLIAPPSSSLSSPFPPGGTISLGNGAYFLLFAGILFLAAPLVKHLVGRGNYQPQPAPQIPNASAAGYR
jgi:hypothetical protein